MNTEQNAPHPVPTEYWYPPALRAAVQGDVDASDSPAANAKPLLSVSSAWRAVVRRWRFALPVGLLLAGLAGAVFWYLFEPAYVSRAWLRIRRQRPVIVMTLPQEEDRNFVETQVETLRSPVVLSQVLLDPEIAKLEQIQASAKPEQWLQDRLSVRVAGQSELFILEFRGPSSESAFKILSKAIDAFMELHNRQSDTQTRRLLELLQAEKENQLKQVVALQDKVLKLTKQSTSDGAFVVNPFGNSLIGVDPRLTALHQELIRAQVDRDVANAQYRWKKELLAPQTVSQAVIEYEISEDPVVKRLQRQIEARQQTLSQFKPGSPGYRDVEEEIAQLKASLEALRRQLRSELPKLKREEKATAREIELAALAERLKELVAREKGLLSHLEVERAKLESKTGVRLDQEFAQAELTRAKSVAEKIEDRMFWLGVELRPAGRPERVEILRKAGFPKVANEVPLQPIAAVALIMFALPFGLCIVRDCLLSRRIFDLQVLRRETRMSVIGEVAKRPLRPVLALPWRRRRYEQQQAIYSESITSLCTTLAVYPRVKELKVLMVASAVSGEGKSSLACQLAYNWAIEGGEKVLIIDADLRCPDLHHVFQIKRGPGLAEVLSGQSTPEDSIVHWTRELDVLPAGQSPDRPYRLFCNGTYRKLVAELREQYDRILIDPPPVLSTGEFLKLAEACDGFLFCVRKDVSSSEQVKAAYDRLVQAGIPAIGTVFIGTSPDSYASSYGHR